MSKIDLMMEDWKQLQTIDKTSIRFNYTRWLLNSIDCIYLNMLYTMSVKFAKPLSEVFQGLDWYVKN